MHASHGMANAEQLAILTKSVDDYCDKHAITELLDRESVAIRVLKLYDLGIIDPKLVANSLEHLEEKLRLTG